MYLRLRHLALHFNACCEASDLSHVHSPRSSLQLNKLRSKFREKASLLVPNTRSPHPSPLIFKKAVDNTCSRSIPGCGNHDEENGTECAICLGAVTLRFYGNTPPGVTVTLLSFLSLPAILRHSLGPVKRANRSGVTRGSREKRAGSSLPCGHLILFCFSLFFPQYFRSLSHLSY